MTWFKFGLEFRFWLDLNEFFEFFVAFVEIAGTVVGTIWFDRFLVGDFWFFDFDCVRRGVNWKQLNIFF